MAFDLETLSHNSSISTINDFIHYLESLDGECVKWKSETTANQMVIKQSDHYYKAYAYNERYKYLSIIRYALAEIYRSYGIEWNIVTIKTEYGYLDIEQRQILDVCTNWSDEILRNYSHTLRYLEMKLNFDYILNEIKKEYPHVEKIKLVRNCVNKAQDYAIYKDKVILLDDADWYIALLDSDNKPVVLSTPLINLNINDEPYIFTSLRIGSRAELGLSDAYKSMNKFFIIKNARLNFDEKRLNSLKQQVEYQFDNNIKILCDEDSKIIQVSSSQDDDLLYKNNNIRKSFQWELWPFCNSLCKFCYLEEQNRVNNKPRQLQSLLDLEKQIDILDFNIYNNISIIGGEFFQGQLNDPEIHTKFFNIIRKIFKLYVNKKIGSIWVTCTLTLGDQKHLYELLELAKLFGVYPNKNYGSSGLWLCTSWDAYGRFHNQKMKDNWEYHMQNIHKLYPWAKFNTTIILQQAFIDMYNNGEFKPKEFMEKFNTSLFYKQCGVPFADLRDSMTWEEKFNYWLKVKKQYNEEIFKFNFFPTRKSFLKFLTKYYHEDRNTFDRLFNIKYRADELHRNFNDQEHDISYSRDKIHIGKDENITNGFLLPCDHICYYAPYIDSNHCCICDREMIENV